MYDNTEVIKQNKKKTFEMSIEPDNYHMTSC